MEFRLFNANNAAFLGVSLAFAIVGGMVVFGFFGPWREPDCQTYPIQVVASPGGRFKAEQEQQACAGNDQLRTRVLVSSAGSSAEPVVAFESVTGQAMGAMSVGQRQLMLKLAWEGDDRLVIVHPQQAVSKLPEGTYAGVKVRSQVAGKS